MMIDRLGFGIDVDFYGYLKVNLSFFKWELLFFIMDLEIARNFTRKFGLHYDFDNFL